MYIRQSALCGLTAHIRGRCTPLIKKIKTSTMTKEELKNKQIDAQMSMTNILIQNNALLESIADLIIKTSAKDDKRKKELREYFNQKMKENSENAIRLLVEAKD
jgi:hypothetical protein